MRYTETYLLRYIWRVEILLAGVRHILRLSKDVCFRAPVEGLRNHLPNGLKLLPHGINELRVIGIGAVHSVVMTW